VDDEELILIRNAAEAGLLGSLLREEGIPHFMKVYSGPAFEGLWTYKDSWGHVDAPQEYRQRIRELLEEIRESAVEED
jgi:hypothetical protein